MATAPTNAFSQLPPIPRPPHDPSWWLLDARAGWHAAALGHVAISPMEGRLELDVIPGSGREMTEPSGSFGGLTLPGNAALAPDGSLYLLDNRSGQLKRFDACNCRFDNVPCLGGLGSEQRQVLDPHGVAICAGNLFVCDTGNRRLQVFSLRGFVLRGIWAPPSSAGLVNPWQPWGAAFDGRGRIFVSDPANGCIHRFRATGKWERKLPGLGIVRWIAIDCKDRLYILADDEPAVRILDTDGNALGAASRPQEAAQAFPPLPFEVDAQGNLRLGGLCAPPVSPGVFDSDGAPNKHPAKDPALAYFKLGTYWSQALDSSLYHCQWHRIVLRGTLPRGTAVGVSTFTSEVEQSLGEVQALPAGAWQTNLTVTEMQKGEWDGLIFSGGGRYLWLRLDFAGPGAATPAIERARLEFPRISLRRYLPAVFGEDPGGANFTDRFLSLFDTTLRSIETEVDRQAKYFDPMAAPAVPDPKTGGDFLSWLASWIGVSLDRQWPVNKRRRFLSQAGKFFSIRGTRTGLWRQLLLLLDMRPEDCCCRDDQPRSACVPKPQNCAPLEERPCAWQPPPLILEHYQLRRWLLLGQGRLGDQAVLWGQRIVNRSQLGTNAQAGVSRLITTQDPYRDPFHVYAHQFSVFVPASCGALDHQRRSLINLLESEKPAHTRYQLEYVEPRFRIGFQSMIGLDSVIGRYPTGVTLGQTPLGKASVLSGPPQKQQGPSFEIGRESRIGSTTKLD